MKLTHKLKKPISKKRKFIENFFIKKGLNSLVQLSKKKKLSVNEMISDKPYIPDLNVI